MNDIRVAHILLVHKSPEQVNAFVRQLAADPRADVYVHVDAKCPDAVFRAFASGPNVTVIPERVAVSWGDYSQIEATMALLRAVRASGKAYDFVSLASGQDLLVRDGMIDFLAANKGRNFIEKKPYGPDDPDNFFWKIKWPKVVRSLYDFPFHPYRILRVALRELYRRGINVFPNPRTLPDGWVLHYGSQWFCVSGAAAAYIVDYLERDPGFGETFKDSLTADMFFFQTMLMNSPHAGSVTGANLTYLVWGSGFWGRNHPVVLREADIPAIEASGLFLARKFERSVDDAVIRHFCGKAGAGPKGLQNA